MPRAELSPEEQERVWAELTTQLEALVGETVLGFGFFGHVGILDSSGALDHGGGGFSPFGWLKGRRTAGGLPSQMFLAVTPGRVLAVGYRMGRGGVAPGSVLRAWDRAATQVRVEDPPPRKADVAAGPRVTFEVAEDERPVTLESLAMGYDVNDAVLAVLRGA